jgi:hypothetical protein
MVLRRIQHAVSLWLKSWSRTDSLPLNFWKPIERYPDEVFTIPVLVVRYFPVKGAFIDIEITGDVGGPVAQIRHHTIQTTERVIHTLETGSIYHGYKDPTALPSLRYQIVDAVEFLKPLPTWHNPRYPHIPMTNYNLIMEQIDIRTWVEERGIKEVWIWGYHGDKVGLWESNMAGPYGDVSNSDRELNDLPVLNKSYTVYHYNYQRHTSEAVEDHMHQIEALLNHIDRDMFWNRFVGRVGEGRCGWSHYPPNGLKDYDWQNPRHIWTDIEDWNPEGTGPKKRMTCTRWNCDSLTWFTYWMQNLSGRSNGLSFLGRRLTNWWMFIGDFDKAMTSGLGLVE